MKASHSKQSKHKTVKVKLEKLDEKQTEICLEEKDLTFFVKDRVELMRQVFTILKNRELTAMAPDCVHGLNVETLQEALLDEVLGISSKRLHSILDGYECPSNTDSSEESSANDLETISLDSISSDEDDILNQDHKSKKKHMKKKTKTGKDLKKKTKLSDGETSNAKNKIKNKKEQDNTKDDPNVDSTGMTVLELLELQARARAIRAQLAAVEVKDSTEVDKENSNSESSKSDEDEVVIKEEPPEIVEINSSSDDNDNNHPNKKNKKHGNCNQKKITATDQPINNNCDKISSEAGRSSISENSQQQNLEQQSRKVKLNRSNLLVSVKNPSKNVPTSLTNDISSSNNKCDIELNNKGVQDLDKTDVSKSFKNSNTNNSKMQNNSNTNENVKVNNDDRVLLDKIKSSYNNRNDDILKKKSINRDKKESDEDEITLELSDSEKMDLLEGFHSPRSFITEENIIDEKQLTGCVEILDETFTSENLKSIEKTLLKSRHKNIGTSGKESGKNNGEKRKKSKKDKTKYKKIKHTNDSDKQDKQKEKKMDDFDANSALKNLEVCKFNDQNNSELSNKNNFVSSLENIQEKIDENKSEGECSFSSDDLIEADNKDHILCISDEDMTEICSNNKNRQYRKRKKANNDENDTTKNSHHTEMIKENLDLKTDDEKHTENLDITDLSEKNIPIVEYLSSKEVNELELKESNNLVNSKEASIDLSSNINVDNISDNILEISDDSKDGVNNVLSKEPTIQEIKEFSEKIDYEIERERLDILGDSSIDLKIRENESEESNDLSSAEDISWKTRWLKSDKVQRVLATSNLCNALRKKNKELKKKLENSVSSTSNEQDKTADNQLSNEKITDADIETIDVQVIEGSVSEYEKLTSSTKYVDPVVESKLDEKAMMTDAKQLMKMYKKLIKMHSLDDEVEKKKAKKHKKDKKKEKKDKKNKTKETAAVSETPVVEETTSKQNIANESKTITADDASLSTSKCAPMSSDAQDS